MTADNMDRKLADALAVDEAYQKLDQYYVHRRRIVFIPNDKRREGGYGVVRQAHLHATSYLPTWFSSRVYDQPQVVAVKEIKLSTMYDPSDLKRALTKEILVWSRLKEHPGVAKFLGFRVDFGRKEAWLISPWEPYGNVSEFLRGHELQVPEKLSLAYDTIDALVFLHQLDPPVCHGDIKSANVLVNEECRAVLCDLGLARLHEDSGLPRLETTAGVKGSFPWSSPELLDGEPRTASSDVYAWAWLVWEIMTGELPYQGASADYVTIRRIFESPRPQVNGESRLSDCLQVWELMTRCWLVNMLHRPTSAMCRTAFEYLPHYPPTPKTADPRVHSAALLQNQGDVESWEGNYKAAFKYLEQALHLYEEEGNDKGIATVLRKQVAVAAYDSDHIKAMHAASAALGKCRSLQDSIGVADSLFWIGALLLEENRMAEALQSLQQSLTILRAKGNSLGLAKCLERLGELYQRQNLAKKALPAFEEAVDIASRCGDRLLEVQGLISLGSTHWSLNHVKRAISTLQRASEIAKNIGWELGRSTCLCRLGDLKLEQGRHAEAEELLRESVRVARLCNAGWRLGQALAVSGQCFRAQGRHKEASTALEESCSVYQSFAFDFESELAYAASLLADSKSAQGLKEEALAWYDRAIAEYRKGGDEYVEETSECLAAKARIR